MLSSLGDFPKGTMSIGRLDESSEGLLLLTTDGKVSEQVRSKSVEKEYYVQVNGVITEQAIELMRGGIEIPINGKKYKTLPCKAARLNEAPVFKFPPARIHDVRHGPTSWLSIVISEGKYRQVRKMCAVVGFPVVRLVRVRIGEIKLGELDAAESFEVTDFLSLKHI